MMRSLKIVFFITLIPISFSFFQLSAYSFPSILDKFKKDKYAKEEVKLQGCAVCHTTAAPSAEALTPFGEVLKADPAHNITPDVRKQFLDLFNTLKASNPRISGISPRAFSINKENSFSIKGNNFTPDSSVLYDGENIKDTDVLSGKVTYKAPGELSVSVVFNKRGKHTIQVLNYTIQASNIASILVQ